MKAPMLKIGGVEIALQSFPVNQSYEPIEGAALLRMLNGAGVKQAHWRKLATSISGDGWAPAALAGIDWTQSVEIACAAPRSVHSAAAVATLPSARRSDLTVNVYARAVVDGELVETPVAVVTNTATATAVTGATSYQFWYYPKLSFFSSGPRENLDLAGAAYSWQIDAEEV